MLETDTVRAAKAHMLLLTPSVTDLHHCPKRSVKQKNVQAELCQRKTDCLFSSLRSMG